MPYILWNARYTPPESSRSEQWFSKIQVQYFETVVVFCKTM